jgi:hypothetical protein
VVRLPELELSVCDLAVPLCELAVTVRELAVRACGREVKSYELELTMNECT